jgi:hypothetical protein
MKQNTILKLNSYPKMIQDFAHENFNLKILSAVLLGINVICLVLILFLIKKGPTVIALGSLGEVAPVETKITDLQIEAAVKEYIRHRYSWDEKSIASELMKAKFFVLPSLTSAFEKSMLEVQRFVREKKVIQKVYPKTVTVDLKEKKVTVWADRITEFDRLKAATEMKLSLQFTVDDRTVVNPWGIYITKEAEEAGQ